MRFEGSASIAELWHDVFRELGEPEAILACTFTFQSEFFSELISRFAEASCEGGMSDGRSFLRLPIDVVCDRTRYSGHRVGFNVSFWPDTGRLFHSKLFIVLFGKEVVWSDGSLNLTPSGWHRNREIAILHKPGKRVLPRQLRDMLKYLDGVVAAEHILNGTANEHTADLPGHFLTSIETPIGTRFLAGTPKHADEVHLVAPFFESTESHELSLDNKWLLSLAKCYPHAPFHVYLPQLESTPLRVQGRREIYEAAERILTFRIVLHAVEPMPGPLHGKIACVIHTPRRAQRAYILVGSPNMTYAALLAPPNRGNIETAWILEERSQDARRLLRSIGTKGRSIDDAEFVEPSLTRVSTWMPLSHAFHDPLRHTLQLVWKRTSDASLTDIRYAGRKLSLSDVAHVRNFEIADGISWIVTHKRGGGAVDGCCPIDIPVELIPACKKGALKRTPEEWLKMLGSVSEGEKEAVSRNNSPHNEINKVIGSSYQWSERVRDLASRMRFIEEIFKKESINPIEKQWLLKLVDHIYNSHDLSTTNTIQDQIWRSWVRVELWNASKNLSLNSPSRHERTAWCERTKRYRRSLKISKLPRIIRSQLHVLIMSLRDEA